MKLRALLWLVGFSLLSTPAATQQLTGTMSGVVKDPQGTVLRDVTVKISGVALARGARTAVTNEKGTYNFAALPPGIFTVSFELSGFKTLKREGVTIQAALTTGVDAVMGTGTLEGTVIVSGEARIIDTTTPTKANIDAFPLDGIVLSLDSMRLVFVKSLPDTVYS
jgi:hypothetical protein